MAQLDGNPEDFELPVETEPSVVQILLSAAALIEERGLAQLEQEDEHGRLCLHGAISVARFGKVYQEDSLTCRASDIVGEYLRSQGVSPELASECGSAGWNNQTGRTGRQVADALRGAAELARARALLAAKS